jgi:hypothetical protein
LLSPNLFLRFVIISPPFEKTRSEAAEVAILVQDKNRVRGSKPSQLLGEDFFTVFGPKPRQDSIRKSFDNIISNNPTVKLLYLLFDFGTNDVSLEVSYSKAVNPRIRAIHSKGMNKFSLVSTASMFEIRSVRYMVPPVKDDDIAVTYHEDHVYNVLHVDKYQEDGNFWTLKQNNGGQPKLNKKAAVLEDPFRDY